LIVVCVVQIAFGFDIGAAKLKDWTTVGIVPLLWPLIGGQSQLESWLGTREDHVINTCMSIES
jgi:hypothetical protein